MKLTTVISEDEEIVIKCKARTGKIIDIEAAIQGILRGGGELSLYLGDREYLISKSDILFFQTEGKKVFAHTATGMYQAKYKLFELEDLLPSCFLRISKSTIANVSLISSIRRELTGNGEITFSGCGKKAYFSRSYYGLLRNKIDETRLKK